MTAALPVCVYCGSTAAVTEIVLDGEPVPACGLCGVMLYELMQEN